MLVIEFLQHFDHPVIYYLMRFVSIFGDRGFYVIMFPLAYWFWRREDAIRLTILLCISIYVNIALKQLFHQPRPEAMALIDMEGFAFPSGHAQHAVVMWGFLALNGRKYFKLAIVMAITIGISRLYLGVHWPIDLAGGWLIGAILLFSFVLCERRWNKKTRIYSLWLFLTLFLGLTLLITLFSSVQYSGIVMGTLFGLVSGGIFAQRVGMISSGFSLDNIVLVVIIGVAGICGIYFVMIPIAYLNEGSLFLTSGIISIWISIGTPWAVQKVERVLRRKSG